MRGLATGLLIVCAGAIAGAAVSVSGKPAERSPPSPPVIVAKDAPDGAHPYIVLLADAPLATHRGGVAGLAATSLDARGSRKRQKLDIGSAVSVAYLQHLHRTQERFRSSLAHELGFAPVIERNLHVALNAVVVRLTPSQVPRVTRLPGVRGVEPSRPMPLDTDRGPIFIGASGIWDGTATGLAGIQGEGIVVGTLDSGINGDHPSFAAIGGDGYAHVNPLGAGHYLGECFATPDLVCNDKLIGRYNFTGNGTPAPSSEDQDGHGSHVASTLAGNWVYGAPIIDFEGNPSGYSIGTLHGVAPHANIVAYRVCNPTCFSADVVAAIEQAIVDGVDVLNKSISSPGGSPWENALSLAALSVRAAGISFAISAGNDGPEPGTVATVNAAPWNAVVAAATHDRRFVEKSLSGLAGGDTPPPAGITGRGLTGGVTGRIVNAAQYDNGDADPGQCLRPFPPGTWTNGEIVLCDRGTIGRLLKCIYVRDAGGAGCILANVDGGDTDLVDDAHVLPAIHVDAAHGNALKAWLASGSDHRGTIEVTPPPIADPAVADHMADFSSRGPNGADEWLAPNLAAPGVDIYAAYRTPIEYGFLSGTSMASPHVAGAMALLRQLHADWTDAEILSALMTTAMHALVKEDGATPADPFDYGAGRVQVDRAANAGLLLDESVAAFEAANPALGGDPKTLNVAAMVDAHCLISCGWRRTVRAAVDGTWSAETSGALALSVEPSQFSLEAGGTQELSITVDASTGPHGEYAFGAVTLTPQGAAPPPPPPAVMQVAVVPTTAELPQSVSIAAERDAGSQLVPDLRAIEITELQLTTYGLSKGETRVLSITGETGEFSPYDQPDGVGVTFVDVPDGALRFVVRTFDSEAPDADLFVGRDDDLDGEIAPEEERCNSGTAASDEYCEIGDPEAGSWWVAVINYAASEPDATDDTKVQLVPVIPTAGNFEATGPEGHVPPLEPFDLRLYWDLDDAQQGDIYYGNVVLGSQDGHDDNLGGIPVTLTRVEDDVAFTVNALVGEVGEPVEAEVGDILDFEVAVQLNLTIEDRSYDIEATIPGVFSFIDDSLKASAGDARIEGDRVHWTLLQAAGTDRVPATLRYELRVEAAANDSAVTAQETSIVSTPGGEPVTESVIVRVAESPDTDGDGIYDGLDNCTQLANPAQCDSDLDGYGNDCDGDFDDSGFVNYGDLAQLRVGFFRTNVGDDELDMNCDGAVNMLDLGRFAEAFGAPPGPSGLAR